MPGSETPAVLLRKKAGKKQKERKMFMSEMLKAILFGIVEGITEWLPVSSTGHMIILDELIKLNVSKEFLEVFLVVIQLGAILAVVMLYWNQLWPFSLKEKRTFHKKRYLFHVV